MNKVFFSNSNASSIRLEYYVGGDKQTARFEAVSSMVNFCRENGIDVLIDNCITED